MESKDFNQLLKAIYQNTPLYLELYGLKGQIILLEHDDDSITYIKRFNKYEATEKCCEPKKYHVDIVDITNITMVRDEEFAEYEDSDQKLDKGNTKSSTIDRNDLTNIIDCLLPYLSHSTPIHVLLKLTDMRNIVGKVISINVDNYDKYVVIKNRNSREKINLTEIKEICKCPEIEYIEEDQ
jgi:hypothetical protein